MKGSNRGEYTFWFIVFLVPTLELSAVGAWKLTSSLVGLFGG